MEIKETMIDKLLCVSCLCVGRTLHNISDQRMRSFYLEILKEIPLNNIPQICPSICWECTAVLRKAVRFREQVKDSFRILQTYTNENIHECLLSDIKMPSHLTIHSRDPVSIAPSDDAQKDTDDHFNNDEHDVLETQLTKCEPSIIEDYNLDKLGDDERRDDERPRNVQMIYVKDEVKVEYENDNDVFHMQEEPVLSDYSDIDSDIRKLIKKNETKISTSLSKSEKKKRKKGADKIKRAKKIVRKLKNDNKLKQPKEKAGQKILTIELSYEEMLVERENDSQRDSYLKAEYKCKSCLIGFNYVESYNKHISGKHSQVMGRNYYYYGNCSLARKKKNKLNLQKAREALRRLSNAGSSSEEPASNMPETSNNSLIMSDLGDYACPICKTVISSVESFTAHYKRHMKRYECSICHKRTMDMKVMQQHYYSTHEISLKEYKCNFCGKVSNSIDTHRYHKDTHKARVQCPDCDKTFSHRAGLMNHRLTVHFSCGSFPCQVCNKVFRYKSSLKRHLSTHSARDQQAYCTSCHIGFNSLSSYKRHLRSSLKHVAQNQLRFICDHCNKRFADKTKLRDHIEEKHLFKTYQCSICNKSSKNRVGLDQHMRNVHKGRPNNKMCHHCGKGFPTKVQLESHIRTHTGERPFICEFCPTTFSQQSNLYKHNRQVHQNIKSKRYPVGKKSAVSKEVGVELPAPVYDARLQYTPDRNFI